MIFIELAVLFVSVAFLAKSSELVVNHASKLSSFFGISSMAIGFILVAISTSLPELSVSVLSSTSGNGAIAAGNVFGSNIANILLVLGLGGFLYGFSIRRSELKDVTLVLVATTVISAYVIYAASVSGHALSFTEGILLLITFGIYAYYMLGRRPLPIEQEPVGKAEAMRSFLFFFAAILIVLVSAGFVVESAVKIAQEMGLAESFIGATLVAVGTSLPELSIDVQAIRKKQYGLALGDAIGSNMVNLTLVLGAAASINPISVQLPIFIIALLFAIVANVVLFYVAAVDRKLTRRGGLAFLALYGFYLLLIFLSQAKSVAGI